MSEKLVYPFMTLSPLELFKYRETLLEMLADSGFRWNIQSHEDLPIDLNIQAFQARFAEIKKRQMTQIQDKTAGTSSDIDHFDPLVNVAHQSSNDSIEEYNSFFEECLFIYAEQDLLDICNSTTSVSPLLQMYTHHQTKDDAQTQILRDPVPARPNSILVVFSRQPSILTSVYADFVAYLEHYGVTDGILISQDGASSKIHKLYADLNHEGPNVRIFNMKLQLFYNTIRYQPDIPLYRRLNPLEVAYLELKYGSRDNFPKLLKSKPVASYYGFRIGDVVLVAPTLKRFPKFAHVQAYIESEQDWIEPFVFCIVTDDQLRRKLESICESS